MRELLIAATRLGARMFRQNVGMGWIGKANRITRAKHVQVYPGDVILSNARPFHAGFEGLSDLGGWVPVTVTPDMVGQVVAVYAQAEVKDGGRASKEQLRWIDAVKRAGGIAGIVRSEDDLRGLFATYSGTPGRKPES